MDLLYKLTFATHENHPRGRIKLQATNKNKSHIKYKY